MTKMRNLKRLCLLAAFLVAIVTGLHSQTYQVVPNLNLQTNSVGTFPCSDLRWGRTVFLLRPADMAAAGVPFNKTFNFLTFRQTVAGTPGITGTVKIYLQNTNDVTNTKSTTWTTCISTMTQVANTPFTFPSVAGIYKINLSNFTYTTGGLYVAIEYSNPSGAIATTANSSSVNNGVVTTPSIAFRAQTTSATAPATFTNSSSFRPEMQLGFEFPNDANVVQVYTLGKMPIEYGSPTIIQAAITNSGSLPISNVPVTCTITGTNSFTDVQNTPTIAPGATAIVNFANYTPSSLSTNDVVTVTVPSDDNLTNNSKTWNMNITPNVYTYKNPAVINTGGVGFTGGTGDFVAKFNSNIGQNYPYNLNNPAINEIKVDFFAGGQSYNLGIWDATGVGGTPGALLWQSPVLTSAVGTAIIPVPDVYVSGDYYVGVRQTGTVNISFAYQAEAPVRPGTFYYTAPTGGTSWTDFNTAGANFRLAIEVTVHLPVPPNCATNFLPVNNSTVPCQTPILSWGNGGGAPTGYDVYFSSNLNDVQSQSASALVSANQPGTTYTPVTAPSTQYYWMIIPENSDGYATGCSVQTFTTGVLPNCYCTPTYTTQCQGPITNVTFGTISNTTACSAPGYACFPAFGSTTTDVTQNVTLPLSVTTSASDIISVWIDYNQNGTFDASEWTQVTTASVANTPATVNITIPPTANTGLTLMRIRTRFAGNQNGATDACLPMGSGESEDYVINILPEPQCSGTPNPGNTLASITSYCPNISSSVTLSLQNTVIGTGVSYQWEVADDVNFTTNLVALGTSNTQAYTMPGGSKYFRCNVTCSNSGLTGISTPIQVVQSPFNQCYCTSVPTFGDDEDIYNVTIGTGSTDPAYANANNCTTVAPGPGSIINRYSNFTTLAPIASVALGATVPFSVDQNECDGPTYYAAGIGIWIDFNQNGVFTDPGENVYSELSTTVSPRTASGTITIPTNALTGNTRMRVICAEGLFGASLTPCINGGTYGYGETEDYLINIENPQATLNLKCFIQGYYISDNTDPNYQKMRPALFNQIGAPNTTITDCDTITVELHDATAPYAIATGIPAFVGVLNTDGNLTCNFPPTAIGNNYYIALKHRNALETWSANPVTISAVTSYDFTNLSTPGPDTKSYGPNQIEVEPGIWALISGDFTSDGSNDIQDGAVDGFDYAKQDPLVINGDCGFYASDLNGDGCVDAFDYVLLDPNIIIGYTVNIPQ